MHPDYLTTAAANRREELLRSASSRRRMRQRVRRTLRLWLLIHVRRVERGVAIPVGRLPDALADRDGALSVLSCCRGQVPGCQ